MKGTIKLAGSGPQPDLFVENPTEAGSGLLDRIEELFELSNGAYHVITSAQMYEPMTKPDLERYMHKIFDAVGKAVSCSTSESQSIARAAAEKAAFDRGDPIVRTVLNAAYKVDHEIHRLMGLLRFSPRSDAIWLARCAPDNYILPVFADHFTARFGEAQWAIIDEKRSLALVRLEDKKPCFGPLSSFSFLSDSASDSCTAQDNWEELWRFYHQSISIENRRNPYLQIQFMPRRYWKYLPELKS
jgi:probable DNA metabolism protein